MKPSAELQALADGFAPLPEPTLVVATGGEVLAANLAAGELFACPSADLIGRSVLDAVAAEHRSGLGEYLRLCAGSRALLPGGFTICTARDAMIECRTEGALLRPATVESPAVLLLRIAPKSEAVARFIALNQKIEELTHEIQQRRRIEERLQQLARIVQSSADAIFSATPAGIITSWNKGAENIYGYSPSDVLGKHVSMLVPPDRRAEIQRFLTSALQGDPVAYQETERVRKDGQRFWVAVSIAPLRDLDARIIGVSSISRDITALKMAHEALLRTEKLAVMGRMAATIAHEINNPLEAVTNLLYLINMEAESGNMEALRRHLHAAEHEMERVAAIVRHTLGFYRDPQGQTQVKLAELLHSALALHTGRLRIRDITVHQSVDQDISVLAMPGELRQVLNNLIANAIDALPRGGRLWIRLYRGYDWRNGGRPGVRIVIADDGPGIPPEHLARLFQPFFTTKETVGTGLGLWVSKTIIDQHDGTVRVRSCAAEPRSGTVFSIFLPLAAQAESALRRIV